MTNPAGTDASMLKQRGAVMRLTLSASVANDLKRLKASLKHLAESLGHSACATGCHSLFLHLERDFVVKMERDSVVLNTQPAQTLTSLDPSHEPMASRALNVTVAGAVLDNIESLGMAIEKVVGRLGCPRCCSGFDIAFKRELDGFTVNPKLEINGTGRFGS